MPGPSRLRLRELKDPAPTRQASRESTQSWRRMVHHVSFPLCPRPSTLDVLLHPLYCDQGFSPLEMPESHLGRPVIQKTHLSLAIQ